MRWMERFEAKVDVILSRWFLSASAPRPTAFANPWSPGAGPWRFGEHTVPALRPPAAAFDPKPSTAKAPGVTYLTAPARW
jgi:hypothetical protein